ncbi:membrane 11B-like [Octopus vulgaris]|uniref:Membrane 11B-like n=2 Tax=Octopus TaxID=6643 RepID=A0AA36EZW0_OCTVU|nr:peroxisomal membrane protein 11A [Octopus sinensis]CAI9720456.1 membrane 11B-like [Octopus vulgaris]
MGDTNNNEYLGALEIVAVIDQRPSNNISALPAQMGPVKELTDHYIQFVSKTSGRDKLCRLIQYSSKFAWWYIQKSHYQAPLVQKLKLLDSSISTSRKMFRFGKSFELLNSTLKTLHVDDIVLRTLISLAKINNALYLLFDNLIWLDRVGMLKVNRSKISELSAQFWLASILCSIGRDFYQLGCITNNTAMKNCSQLQLYVFSLLKNKPLLFDLIRNTTDLPLPMAMLHHVNLSPGVLGLLGMISSYIGILTEWNPDYKIFPS